MQTILIVDDEPDIREILSFNLEQAGYRCLTAANGRQALERLTMHDARCTVDNTQCTIDLVLLDVLMPELSGYDVARSIRNDEVPGVPYDLPIIFLTALGEEDDMLHGFSLGADDYIAKPFSLRVLVARIEAVMKRAPFQQTSEEPQRVGELCYERLCLNEKNYRATIENTELGLTKMEYELLHFLLRHQGVVYSRNELLEQVWPDNGLVLDRTVDVTITRLRKKIGPYKNNLKAKTGYGYYWEK